MGQARRLLLIDQPGGSGLEVALLGETRRPRAQTEADGQIVGNIVSQLLVPTAFSSVK